MAAVISFQPCHGTLNQRCSTSISWDDGKEIRNYHLGPGNVLQESAYSESNGRKIWYQGYIHDLKIVLDPTSSLAAIRYRTGNIRVYYQDPNDDFIRALYRYGDMKKWTKDGARKKAVKGSSIAAICWSDANGLVHFRMFYQDPELRLREYVYDPSADSYYIGDFNPGVQPRGTPISAELVRGGNVDITVMWRDADGRAASSSWSKSSGWDLPPNLTNDGSQVLDGLASSRRSRSSAWDLPLNSLDRPNDGSQVIDGLTSPSGSLPNFVQAINHPLTTLNWENGKEIRIYYLDSKRTLQEYAYSEEKRKNCWYYGTLFKLKIVLSPNSVIAAIRFNHEIRIYYQDNLGIIQELCQPSLTDSWVKGACLGEAAESSMIAVIGWTNNGKQARVYYQDPTLRLQERCYENESWAKGAFNPGAQPRGTPIIAEVAYIGYPAIQVSWKNDNGRFLSSRCDKHSRWDQATAENGDSNEPDPSQLDGSG
ncbi:hypothetical protein BYT27DRAFT_7198157 [Phlegmacium glaucopus]|nr:hypothetical protein BYT27DRAFT_7198157 [Phlegmacium glaucopus]